MSSMSTCDVIRLDCCYFFALYMHHVSAELENSLSQNLGRFGGVKMMEK